VKIRTPGTGREAKLCNTKESLSHNMFFHFRACFGTADEVGCDRYQSTDQGNCYLKSKENMKKARITPCRT